MTRHAIMPQEFLRDRRLSMGAKLMLTCLWGRGPGGDKLQVYAPKPALRATLDVSRQTLDRWAQELAAAGWATHKDATWELSMVGEEPMPERKDEAS